MRRCKEVDWRGWVTLAWVVFWGGVLLQHGGSGARAARAGLVQAAG